MDENRQDKTGSKTTSMEAENKIRLRLLWQQIKKHPYTTGIVVLLVLILFIFLAYRFGWDWTGFNSGTSQITITSISKVNYKATVSQPSKSLWDWLQFLGVLAIPVVVGFGATWFTRKQQLRDQQLANDRAMSERKAADERARIDRNIAQDNQRENALQAYIDKTSELLLHDKLSERLLDESSGNHQVVTIAVARTVTVLRVLDQGRRGSLIRFLSKAGILTKCIEHELVGIDLREADLRAIDFSGTDLSQANLSQAKLQKSILIRTVLANADLSGANLSGANLTGANLKEAKYNTQEILKKDEEGQPVFDKQGNPVMLGKTEWPDGFVPQTEGAICVDCQTP